MTSPSGFRRQTAIINASSASSHERVGFIDLPTTLRAKRSITTARYNHPSQVRSRVRTISLLLLPKPDMSLSISPAFQCHISRCLMGLVLWICWWHSLDTTSVLRCREAIIRCPPGFSFLPHWLRSLSLRIWWTSKGPSFGSQHLQTALNISSGRTDRLQKAALEFHGFYVLRYSCLASIAP